MKKTFPFIVAIILLSCFVTFVPPAKAQSSLCFFRDCSACDPMVIILVNPQNQTELAHFIWAPDISWCRENAEAGPWDYLITGECGGETIGLEGSFEHDGVSTYEEHVTCEDVGITTTSTSTDTTSTPTTSSTAPTTSMPATSTTSSTDSTTSTSTPTTLPTTSTSMSTTSTLTSSTTTTSVQPGECEIEISPSRVQTPRFFPKLVLLRITGTDSNFERGKTTVNFDPQCVRIIGRPFVTSAEKVILLGIVDRDTAPQSCDVTVETDGEQCTLANGLIIE